MKTPRYSSKHFKREYRSWSRAKSRCNNPNEACFRNYGGRGIKMCAQWSASFEAFLKDVGPRPPGTTLERLDNDRGYEPGNCKWATHREQSNNRRSNLVIEFNGTKKTLAEWSRFLGINLRALKARRRLGWPIDKLLIPTRRGVALHRRVEAFGH